MKKLDLMAFPLEGLALIEASAGTGKTYTLANLYLRYLIEKNYSVEQILVVTFTEAATQELKQRIRLRIGDLRRCLEACQQNPAFVSEDALLNSFCAKIDDSRAALLRLRIAERQMDEAEIYTIHGFCQRMLQQHALSLGTPLSQELNEDMLPLLREQCLDFWRSEILALPDVALEFVRARWADPEVLLQALGVLLQRQPEVILPALDSGSDSMQTSARDGVQRWCRHLEQAHAWLQSLKDQTRLQIASVIERVQTSDLQRLKDKLRWLEQIASWAEQDDVQDLPKDSKGNSLLARFVPEHLAEQCKKGKTPPTHPWFGYLEQQLAEQPEGLAEQFLHVAYCCLKQDIQIRKRRGAILGFDDLILELAAALNVRLDPERKQALVGLVRSHYAIALIDEFQDTDPAQYQIFNQLFASGLADQPPALVLIGDPKQAIYAFRGGDIATYLRAKKDIQSHPQGSVFTMDTNWRSSPAMVAAVNTVFGLREAPFFHQDIPFVHVQAGKDEDGGFGRLPALSLRFASAQGRSKPDIDQVLARDCAGQISALLNPEGPMALKAADIAILVRTAREAELLRTVLADFGIRASFETRARIYDSEEALGVYLLLAAIAEPGQPGILRQCLAHPMLAMSDRDLEDWSRHSAVQAELHSKLLNLQVLWERAGVLAMIREALVSLGVLQRWRQTSAHEEQGNHKNGEDWERRLSNINQLAELLQEASRVETGHHALLRWLRRKIQQQEAVNDDNRMRLESDDQLVKIVTIHKSKGLEYPVVFLPFMHAARGAQEAWFYDQQGRRALDLLARERTLGLAEQERLEEDMRLLYVALTRARYRCYLGFSDYPGRGTSLGLSGTAWGNLVLGQTENPSEPGAIEDALENLRQLDPTQIELVDVDAQSDPLSGQALREATDVHSAEEASVKRMHRRLQTSWKVQSFTGLVQEGTHRMSAAGEMESSALQHLFHSNAGASRWPLAEDADALPSHILDFPKGSRAGVFLHTLFESVDFESGELLAARSGERGPGIAYRDLKEFIASQLTSAALVAPEQIGHWSERLHAWLKAALETPLIPGLKLGSVSAQCYVAEMTFHFPVAHLSAADLNQVLQREAEDGQSIGMAFQAFEGHIKGAIDLVFEHKGQFFVLDYKSNFLGNSLEDYDQVAMRKAMDEHRYDLQYLLYTVAVHRHLKFRLGDAYSYARDFGGVLYLFLRGLEVHAPEQKEKSGVYFHKPDAALIDSLDRLLASNSSGGKMTCV
ncbi:MAG: exodeoxyribonuclease V subunit beta [Oleiphilus sp.]|nr:MAG: exodeoxyribonuclease V subunit beta [Oleiphilus sp.]